MSVSRVVAQHCVSNDRTTASIPQFFVGNSHGAAWGGNVFCVVGVGVVSNPCVAISTDGNTWSSPSVYDNSVYQLEAVVWGGDQFVAVGLNGCVTSPDGDVWTRQEGLTAVSKHTYEAIGWNGEYYCAVADGGHCATSPDGVNWTYQGGIIALGGGSSAGIVWHIDRWFAANQSKPSSVF